MSSYSHADPIALSFNECCLRMSDVRLLRGPYWLNDQIISFYYEYLRSVKYRNNPYLLFVPPEVTQCMKFFENGELKTLINQLEAPRKSFIFFVVNDNETTQAGGTHWSLLVFSRPENTFFHFDSRGNTNLEASYQLVQRIRGALNCRSCQMKQKTSLQQANGYDCGIHVICGTDNIADYVNRNECVEGVRRLQDYTISAKRSDLLMLIQSLGGKI